MRTGTIKSITYVPERVPEDPKQVQRYLTGELTRISDALRLIADGHFEPVYVSPDKPRPGDVRYADGTNWNPCDGEGPYCYINGIWEGLTKNHNFVTPSTITVTAGGAVTGTVANTQTWADGNVYTVAELAATPGFDIRFNFTGVQRIREIALNVLYSGQADHQVELQIYNYTSTSWKTLCQVPLTLGYDFYLQMLPASDADYISSGSAIVRLYHVSAGNSSHSISTDYVAVVC